jgi:hypothetical protein
MASLMNCISREQAIEEQGVRIGELICQATEDAVRLKRHGEPPELKRVIPFNVAEVSPFINPKSAY